MISNNDDLFTNLSIPSYKCANSIPIFIIIIIPTFPILKLPFFPHMHPYHLTNAKTHLTCILVQCNKFFMKCFFHLWRFFNDFFSSFMYHLIPLWMSFCVCFAFLSSLPSCFSFCVLLFFYPEALHSPTLTSFGGFMSHKVVCVCMYLNEMWMHKINSTNSSLFHIPSRNKQPSSYTVAPLKLIHVCKPFLCSMMCLCSQ